MIGVIYLAAYDLDIGLNFLLYLMGTRHLPISRGPSFGVRGRVIDTNFLFDKLRERKRNAT